MVSFGYLLNRYLYKQYSPGPWLGAFKDLASRTIFYLTPINLFMLSATTYHVTAKEFIWQYAPWANFWRFFGAIVFVTLCAMVVEYKVMVPSSVTFANAQGYKHGNLIRGDLEIIAGEIKRIEEKLEAIDSRYSELINQNMKPKGSE